MLATAISIAARPAEEKAPPTRAYHTDRGAMWRGDSKRLLTGNLGQELRGKVQLVFTSPPFSLNRKKQYGNLNGDAYLDWFVAYAPIFRDLLKADGSIVIE